MSLRNRIITSVVGFVFIAVGISLAVKASLGVMAISMPPYVLSIIWLTDMGLIQFFYYAILALLQIPILGKKYNPFRLTQLLVALLVSAVVSLTGRLLSFPLPDAYPLRLLILLVGIFFCSCGVFLNVEAGLFINAPEGFSQALAMRFGWKFPNVKVVVDCCFVVIGVGLGLLFLGTPEGLREGTLLSAVLLGKLVGLMPRRLRDALHRFHYPHEQPQPAAPVAEPEAATASVADDETTIQ